MLNINEQFPGLIVDEAKTHKFIVRPCPRKHASKGRVLINFNRRDGAKRIEIVKLTTPSGKMAYAAGNGHWDDAETIKMDYDLRVELGLYLDQEIAIEVRRCGFFGTLWWYLTVPDPLVRIPAFLATLSVSLGLLGAMIAFLD